MLLYIFCCRRLGSDGNADLYFTDPEGQSDPQTGSPPREQSAGSRKQTGENEFSNIMAELSERKSKLFRSSASAAKKKNSIGLPPESTAENIVVRDRERETVRIDMMTVSKIH